MGMTKGSFPQQRCQQFNGIRPKQGTTIAPVRLDRFQDRPDVWVFITCKGNNTAARIAEIQFPMRAERFMERELPLSPATERIRLLSFSGDPVQQRVCMIQRFLRKSRSVVADGFHINAVLPGRIA